DPQQDEQAGRKSQRRAVDLIDPLRELDKGTDETMSPDRYPGEASDLAREKSQGDAAQVSDEDRPRQEVGDETQTQAICQQAENTDKHRKRGGEGHALIDRVRAELNERRGKDGARGGVGANDELTR